MNQIKMLEKLSAEIYEIERWPQQRNTKNGEEIYLDYYPVDTDKFFIQLSQLWNNSDEKEILIRQIGYFKNRLFEHCCNNKIINLTGEELENILDRKNIESERNFFIYTTFRFACQVEGWIDKKKASINNKILRESNENINSISRNRNVQIAQNEKPKINQKSFSIAFSYMVDYAGWDPINYENWDKNKHVIEYYKSVKLIQVYNLLTTKTLRFNDDEIKPKDYKNAMELLNYWKSDQKVINNLKQELNSFEELKQENIKARKRS